jgi:uncharacterized lipoprotein YmbA
MRSWIAGLGAIVLLFVGGCANDPPTNFYVLQSLPETLSAEQQADAAKGVALGIGPVTLPQYLDRDQIITRRSRNALVLEDFDQWAQPLTDNFTTALGQNLALLIPTDRIAYFPWRRSAKVDYQVAVDVSQFEGVAGNQVLLVARWSILSRNGEKELLARQSRHQETATGNGIEATVLALNQALDSLSREIADAIRELR